MRRQMWRSILAAAVLGLMAEAAAPARADTSLVFNAAGTFADGATLGGTLTIDTSIGTVTAAILTVGPSDSLTLETIQLQTFIGFGTYKILVGESTNPGDTPYLVIFLPTSSLTGYTGGVIDSTTSIGASNISLVKRNPMSPGDTLTTGGLSVAVPEPNTLLVACMGGVCAIAYGVAKKRRAARTNTRAA
jgi:hypothetical protein